MKYHVKETRRLQRVRRQLKRERDTLLLLHTEGVTTITVQTRTTQLVLTPDAQGLGPVLLALQEALENRRAQLRQEIAGLLAIHVREDAIDRPAA